MGDSLDTSSDSQDEWARRTVDASLWFPAAVYLVLLLVDWLASVTGNSSSSNGRYIPHQPMFLPFWEWLGLATLVATVVLWLCRQSSKRRTDPF